MFKAMYLAEIHSDFGKPPFYRLIPTAVHNLRSRSYEGSQIKAKHVPMVPDPQKGRVKGGNRFSPNMMFELLKRQIKKKTQNKQHYLAVPVFE